MEADANKWYHFFFAHMGPGTSFPNPLTSKAALGLPIPLTVWNKYSSSQWFAMQDYTHLDAWIHILNHVWYHINLVKIIDTHAVCAHNALLATFCFLLRELSQKRNKRYVIMYTLWPESILRPHRNYLLRFEVTYIIKIPHIQRSQICVVVWS